MSPPLAYNKSISNAFIDLQEMGSTSESSSLRGAFLFLALNIGFSLSLDFLLLLIYNLSPFTEGGNRAYDFYP